MTGLSCATALRNAQCTVNLFEKSRGPAGRTGTRRHGDWQCNHGAQTGTLIASRDTQEYLEDNRQFGAKLERSQRIRAADESAARLHRFMRNA